jgi:hypothetical protein
VLSSSTVCASDVGQIVDYFIFLLAMMAGGALLLALATEAILARFFHRKWLWFSIPVFAIGWFAAIFGGFQVWLEIQSRRPSPKLPPAVQKSIDEKSKQADSPPP